MIDALCRFRSLATGWPWTVIAVLGMVAVVDMAAETFRAVKPGADADEDAAGKPLGAIVSVRSAVVGRSVIVTVGTFGRDSNVDADLSLCFGGRYRETDDGNGS